jgi:hypothetical protein
MNKIIYTVLLLLISFNNIGADNRTDEDSVKDEPPVVYARVMVYTETEEKAIKALKLIESGSGEILVNEFPKIIDSIYYTQNVTVDFNSYPPPDLQQLSYFGKGLSKKQADDVQSYKAAVIIDFVYPLKEMTNGSKMVYQKAYKIAQLSNGFLWDSETRELYTIDKWKEMRLDAWEEGIPIINSQIVIHAYQSTNNIRAITLGMSKFGLPDIVVDNFSWSLNKSMSELIVLIGQSLVEGVYPIKDKLKIDISKLKNTEYKTNLVNSLEENSKGRFTIAIGKGIWEEGDPNNFLIKLKFDEFKGKSINEKQEFLLSSIFGWKDDLSYVNHNEQIQGASNNAKSKLPLLKKDFNIGLAPGEFILLKAPFETPDGTNEWMWVEVMSWSGDTIIGLLKNEPFNVPGLKGGTEVTVKQENIFDYIREFPDGSSEGNKTGELIRKFQTN